VTSAPPRVIKANVASQYQQGDTGAAESSLNPRGFLSVKKRKKRTAEFRFSPPFSGAQLQSRAAAVVAERQTTERLIDGPIFSI